MPSVPYLSDGPQVEEALRAAGLLVCAQTPGTWGLVFRNGSVARGAARLVPPWLELRMDSVEGVSLAGPRKAADLWRFLNGNGHWRGGVKFALTPEGPMRLQTEIPVEEPGRLAVQAREACLGIGQAARFLIGGDLPPAEDAHELAATRRGELCEEAGWPHTGRGSGETAVALDAPHGLYHATVTLNARLRACVPVAAFDSASPACKGAAALLLLTASSGLRLARGYAREGAAGFETVLDGPGSAAGLGHALSALSTACRWLGKEVECLRDERTAERYVEMRGWSP